MINSSCIKVFTYEVLVNESKSSLYSFNKIKVLSNQNSKNAIKSKEFTEFSHNISKLLFSNNIIKNTKNNNSTIISLLQKKNYMHLLLLYKVYYTYSARIPLTKFDDNLYRELKEYIYIDLPYLLYSSKNILKEYYIKRNLNIQNLQNDDEIIIKINAENNSKIILMGDQHGSFHSFFRIIIRLIVKGILDENYKLHPDYKIIFLGDIVDRGNYGVEIMYIILRLFIANNNSNELNVILNRGNHEEYTIFQRNGFFNEFKHKVYTKYNNTIHLISFFTYCPSAIILKHNNTKYWLCHGGFPINVLSFDKLDLNNNNITAYIHSKNELYQNSQIRWNDFTNTPNNIDSLRGPNFYEIGTNTLNSFLQRYHINFIIRGHTDNDSNAMLLINKNIISKVSNIKNIKNRWYHINNKRNISLMSSQNNLIKYRSLNKKAENEIAILYPNNFNINTSLYPVLTISNCCDNSRKLYNDSYIIIETIQTPQLLEAQVSNRTPGVSHEIQSPVAPLSRQALQGSAGVLRKSPSEIMGKIPIYGEFSTSTPHIDRQLLAIPSAKIAPIRNINQKTVPSRKTIRLNPK